MSIDRLFTMPCTLVTRRVDRDEDGEPITDEFGNETIVEETISTHHDAPLLCRFEPQRRGEHDEAGEVSEHTGRVWLPSDVDVRNVDAIWIDAVGVVTVVGEPARWVGARHARNDHLELTVQRTVGSEDDVHVAEEVS